MRIAVVGLALPPIMGGLEVHVWELAKQLAGKGHDVHLFGVRKYRGISNAPTEHRDGVLIHRIPGTASLGRFEFYELAEMRIAGALMREHIRLRFDIIHGHCVYPSGIACRLFNAVSGVPYILTSHGDELMVLGTNPVYRKTRRALIRHIFGRAGRIIAVSEELRLLSITFGAPESRTIRMGNVIDPARFKACGDKERIRQSLGLAADRPLVLSLRRLSRKNGVQYLIDAVPLVLREHPRTLFLLCGDGEDRAELVAKVERLGISDSVVFRGSVPNDAIVPYIQASDLAVFPSLAEATSIACLEVMACGVPVVASNVGGLPEIIEDGQTGILVDFGLSNSTFEDPGLPHAVVDAFAAGVNSLLRDPVRRSEMGKKASLDVRSRHTWDAYTTNILQLYRESLDA